MQALINSGIKRCWVPDDVLGWRQCVVMGPEADQCLWCKDVATGQEVIVVENATQAISQQSLVIVDDMITLPEMHEAVILNNIHMRFLKDQIYV